MLRLSSLTRLVAWAGIYFVVLFLFANIRTTEIGVGYAWLAGSVICASLVLLVSVGNPLQSVLFRRSAVFLLAFLVYFALKLLIDLDGLAEISSFALGTSGGLVFAVLFGVVVSLLVTATHNSVNPGPGHILGAAVFQLAVAALAIDTLLTHLGNVRLDKFLIESDNLSYQRPGNFAIIILVVTSLHLASMLRFAPRQGPAIRLLRTGALLVYLMTAATLMVTAQLIGSNSGFVVTLFIALATVVWIWRPDASESRRRMLLTMRSFSPLHVMRRSLAGLAGRAVLTAAIGATAAAMLLIYLQIDIHLFRIFGFSEGTIGGRSLTSRFHLLVTNFGTHFAVNPMFGNLKADALTTGTGSYAHSLVSLLSHVGVVGTALFVAYVVSLYREVRRSRSPVVRLYSDSELGMFRLMIAAVLFGFALIGAFFTWMPLWFGLALLFPPLVLRRSVACRSGGAFDLVRLDQLEGEDRGQAGQKPINGVQNG